jgi:hypothetical protein
MRPFDPELSYQLDVATMKAERGDRLARLWKRFLEWWIFDL